MPAYNREHLISQSLDSINAQLFKDFEIVVVDDGSSDGTRKTIRRYKNVKLIEQSNSGPGAARNRGVEASAGRYIAFLDSDDLWFPWTLKCYAELIQQCNEPAFVTGNPIRFTDASTLNEATDSPMAYSAFVDYLSTGDRWLWYGVSSFVVRRDIFLSVGGFADGCINGEDAELTMKLGTAKGFIHVESPRMFGYRDHPGNVTLDTQKSLTGVELLVTGERQGRYPGGQKRAHERAVTISRHIRPCAIECARNGNTAKAIHLYVAVFGDAMRHFRWQFLLGLPLLAILGKITKGLQHIATLRTWLLGHLNG